MPADAEAFYAQMVTRGLAYGPSFRGIRQLWIADHRALALIAGPELADVDQYRIHPALLDAAFQLLVAAAQSISTLAARPQLFLPTRISEVRFYLPPGDQFWASAVLTDVSESTAAGDIRIFAADGRVCVDVRGLTARLIDSGPGQKQDSADNWLYEYRWESKSRVALPVPTSVPRWSPQFSVATPDWEPAQAFANRQLLETGWHNYYQRVEGMLNDLASAYAVSALIGQGSSFKTGAHLSLDSVVAAGAGEWRRSLAQQLFAMLERAQVVRAVPAGWEPIGRVTNESPDVLAESILRDFPGHRLDVELLARCGPRLSDVLAGRCDGREVLFSENGFAFLEQFYRDSPASSFYNVLLARMIAQLAAVETTQPVRILEVGGGTGGTTAHILPGLAPDRVSYVFTDISPAFTERARARFAPYPFFASRLFDVTADPGRQGLNAGSFDIIIAANVLHATPDLERAIGHLQELLAPGGALVLLEITRIPTGWTLCSV